MNRPIRSGKRRLSCMVCRTVIYLFYHKFWIILYEIVDVSHAYGFWIIEIPTLISSFSEDKDVCIVCDRGSVTHCRTSCKIANSGRAWTRRPHVLMPIILNVPRRAPLQNMTAAVWYFRYLCAFLISTVPLILEFFKFTCWFYRFLLLLSRSRFCSYRWNGLQLLVSESQSESKKWHV